MGVGLGPVWSNRDRPGQVLVSEEGTVLGAFQEQDKKCRAKEKSENPCPMMSVPLDFPRRPPSQVYLLLSRGIILYQPFVPNSRTIR